jgi:2-oxoglutarate/2-oxoacid ferredoxin oxidoreductase subunit alpha
MINSDIFTLTIGGQAGQGIKSAGLMFAKIAVRSGYYSYDYTEYPSLIRGGHNIMQINVSRDEVTAPFEKTDFLIALNQQTIDLHVEEIAQDGGILYDSESSVDTSKINRVINTFPVPLKKLSEGKELLINTVALGAVTALLRADIQILKDLITEEFGDKGQEIVEMNFRAAEGGYKYIQENFNGKIKDILKPIEVNEKRIVLNGNEAVALGAIAGGLQFAAIYPMSPISNILHILSLYQEKYGYVYKQPEDEIAAINMVIGASFAGARSMTATSGGGFALMSEGYGLAGITETPVVIIEGMRGGPATGLPTWSGQGDLRFVLHAHQDDFLRIVLAPGDAKEAFHLTMKALNLAEKYQTPVVVLINKDICENGQSFSVFDTSSYEVKRGKLVKEALPDFKRYILEEDGISTRSVPGSGNFFIANSDEHDEVGYSNEEIENRNKQMEKRMKKLVTCMNEDMEPPVLYGPENAEITLVSWGSNKGSILQAIKGFENVNYLHITWMNPFPTEAVKEKLGKAKYLVNIEANFTAQLATLIKEKTGIEILDNMLKYDGRPFFVEEIIEKINSVLKE